MLMWLLCLLLSSCFRATWFPWRSASQSCCLQSGGTSWGVLTLLSYLIPFFWLFEILMVIRLWPNRGVAYRVDSSLWCWCDCCVYYCLPVSELNDSLGDPLCLDRAVVHRVKSSLWCWCGFCVYYSLPVSELPDSPSDLPYRAVAYRVERLRGGVDVVSVSINDFLFKILMMIRLKMLLPRDPRAFVGLCTSLLCLLLESCLGTTWFPLWLNW